VLGPHTEVEEHGLFPLLADDFPDHVAALEAEHRRAETVLAAASARTPADPDWPYQLMETLDVLRDHILYEQDGVFPAALTTLSGAVGTASTPSVPGPAACSPLTRRSLPRDSRCRRHEQRHGIGGPPLRPSFNRLFQ
jgi:hypothetical protein